MQRDENSLASLRGKPSQPGITAVLGGTGFLGGRIVRTLSNEGHHVRVAVRHPERAAHDALPDDVERVQADVTHVGSLRAALQHATGVVNAVSLYSERGPLTFEAVHVEGARNVAMVARQVGARLVHVSGIGSDPEATDGYVRARGKGEQAVRDAHPAAVILRSAVMFGPADSFLTTLMNLVQRSPVYPVFGKGATKLQPVHVEDVAAAVACLFKCSDPARLYEVAGPDVFTYRQLLRHIADRAGVRARFLPLPFPVWTGLACFAEHMPGAPLTRHQVALMRIDNVADPDVPGLSDLGLAPEHIDALLDRRLQKASSTKGIG
ncbi:complex I NDUFA9 subunit family protein [Tranquillimonas alkanivorans]|uniref:NADH dehydrogenase n=1 Tax=Tranquillimonas alkanivorans TaxID=441119 RepID=A0A1I5V8Y7_9RHOB|nr:complex I NDUFA9 subunit family protein [Tranquillimonas alkanivorans]SFQ03890.1 NADH dehydrogenase [Tranquillimonas alkanivorans]